jgi:hypothetical protein
MDRRWAWTIAAGLLAGCASAPTVAPERVYEGRVSLSDGRVSWSCRGRQRERVRLAFRDEDDDGRWDDDEPGTLERRCVTPEDPSPRRSTPPAAPSVRVPSSFSLNRTNHLDRFTFESGAGEVVIRDARDRPERVTGVTELSLYTNVIVVRTRDGEGRVVPADHFVRAEWAGEADEPD